MIRPRSALGLKYVELTLGQRAESYAAGDTIPLSQAKESIELGKKLYVETGCVSCHGTLGRGDGPSASTLKDDWGHAIRAADLTQRWTFRGGASREDIFRTMTTGLNGTPMPSFLEALTPEQRWAIADFIVSLSGSNGPGYTNLVIAKPVQDPIDLEKGAASFESAPVARFPITAAPSIPDITARNVSHASLTNLLNTSTAIAHIDARRLRPLGVTSAKRFELSPASRDRTEALAWLERKVDYYAASRT